jgi:hypothetical protein
VASKAEILATLDAHGRLEGMPFMPEMFDYCGKRFRVQSRAHKGCDTINPVRMRALPNGVMLEGIRCNGAAHGGCQAACTLFWKEAWLKPVAGENGPAAPLTAPASGGCAEQDVIAGAIAETAPGGKIRYSCQATDFPMYTEQLRTLNLGQFVEDVRARNVKPAAFIGMAAYFAYDFLFKPQTIKTGGAFRWLYDQFQKIAGGVPYPRRFGVLEDSKAVELAPLNLQPGELVRVKPYEEILATLDKANMNRGLMFDAEMVPYCGGVFRVRSRVETFVDERTGFTRKMKTPGIILENVWCRSHFSNARIACPRAIYAWWREGWLERAPEAEGVSIDNALGRKGILKGLPREIPA